jgi:hypothetical protein
MMSGQCLYLLMPLIFNDLNHMNQFNNFLNWICYITASFQFYLIDSCKLHYNQVYSFSFFLNIYIYIYIYIYKQNDQFNNGAISVQELIK